MRRSNDAFPSGPNLAERTGCRPRFHRISAAFGWLCAAACSSLQMASGADRPYAVLTDTGPILIELDGFARGYTHSALLVLVREGVERAGRGQVVPLTAGEATPTRRMVLHVEEGFRPVVAQITLSLFDAGRLIKSSSTRAPAPDAFPNAVFIDTVAGLTWRLLPPRDRHASEPSMGGAGG